MIAVCGIWNAMHCVQFWVGPFNFSPGCSACSHQRNGHAHPYVVYTALVGRSTLLRYRARPLARRFPVRQRWMFGSRRPVPLFPSRVSRVGRVLYWTRERVRFVLWNLFWTVLGWSHAVTWDSCDEYHLSAPCAANQIHLGGVQPTDIFLTRHVDDGDVD